MVSIMENITAIRQKKFVKILLLVIEVLIVVICFWFIFRNNNEGPVISIDSSITINYSGDNEKELLKGVTARDEEDGDVTDSLMIKSTVERTDGKILVAYAAKDKDDNVTVETRLIEKSDSGVPVSETTSGQETSSDEGSSVGADGVPVLTLKTTAVTIKKGTAFVPLDHVEKAEDDKDDAWRRIQVSGSYDINKAGTYTITYRIIDSDGNSSEARELKLTVGN